MSATAHFIKMHLQCYTHEDLIRLNSLFTGASEQLMVCCFDIAAPAAGSLKRSPR